MNPANRSRALSLSASVKRRRELDAEYHAAKAAAEGLPRDPKQSWRAGGDDTE